MKKQVTGEQRKGMAQRLLLKLRKIEETLQYIDFKIRRKFQQKRARKRDSNNYPLW